MVCFYMNVSDLICIFFDQHQLGGEESQMFLFHSGEGSRGERLNHR